MCWPVRSEARLTQQMAVVTKEFSNRMPSAASRSIFGVLRCVLPMHPMAFCGWSSVKIKTMLGRSGSFPAACSEDSGEASKAVRIVSVFFIFIIELSIVFFIVLSP